jgi:hypothetical protein
LYTVNDIEIKSGLKMQEMVEVKVYSEALVPKLERMIQ